MTLPSALTSRPSTTAYTSPWKSIPLLAVNVDPQVLASAVTNLLSNAFKYSRAGSRVLLRVRATEGHVAIEVEDACGGFPESKSDLFERFGERRAKNRTGVGLGLSIARKAVRPQGGDIACVTRRARLHVRNRAACSRKTLIDRGGRCCVVAPNRRSLIPDRRILPPHANRDARGRPSAIRPWRGRQLRCAGGRR